MTDIVDSLRKLRGPYVWEAADEIERLREEVLELKNLIQATVNYTGVSVSNQDYAFHPIPAKGGEK